MEQPRVAYNWRTNWATGLRLVPNESPEFVDSGADRFFSILIHYEGVRGVLLSLGDNEGKHGQNFGNRLILFGL